MFYSHYFAYWLCSAYNCTLFVYSYDLDLDYKEWTIFSRKSGPSEGLVPTIVHHNSWVLSRRAFSEWQASCGKQATLQELCKWVISETAQYLTHVPTWLLFLKQVYPAPQLPQLCASLHKTCCPISTHHPTLKWPRRHFLLISPLLFVHRHINTALTYRHF